MPGSRGVPGRVGSKVPERGRPVTVFTRSRSNRVDRDAAPGARSGRNTQGNALTAVDSGSRNPRGVRTARRYGERSRLPGQSMGIAPRLAASAARSASVVCVVTRGCPCRHARAWRRTRVVRASALSIRNSAGSYSFLPCLSLGDPSLSHGNVAFAVGRDIAAAYGTRFVSEWRRAPTDSGAQGGSETDAHGLSLRGLRVGVGSPGARAGTSRRRRRARRGRTGSPDQQSGNRAGTPRSRGGGRRTPLGRESF